MDALASDCTGSMDGAIVRAVRTPSLVRSQEQPPVNSSPSFKGDSPGRRAHFEPRQGSIIALSATASVLLGALQPPATRKSMP